MWIVQLRPQPSALGQRQAAEQPVRRRAGMVARSGRPGVPTDPTTSRHDVTWGTGQWPWERQHVPTWGLQFRCMPSIHVRPGMARRCMTDGAAHQWRLRLVTRRANPCPVCKLQAAVRPPHACCWQRAAISRMRRSPMAGGGAMWVCVTLLPWCKHQGSKPCSG